MSLEYELQKYPKDIKLSDNPFGSSYFVISNRVREALTLLAGNSNVEFLPVSILNHKGRLASKDYFIMNPLDIVDCIDQEKSGVVWNAINPNMISSCEKFVLKEDAIPENIGVFRPKFMLTSILIRREIAAKLSAPEMTGVFFVEPSKYTG